MQAEWGLPRRVEQGSRDGAGCKKRDTSGGVVVFSPSSSLVIIWDSLGAGRVRSSKACKEGNPTCTLLGTPGVLTVVGGRQGIGERTLLAQPGVPDGKGKVWPRSSESERAYIFGRRLAVEVSSTLFEARTSKSQPSRQYGGRVQYGLVAAAAGCLSHM